ncbi:hypothetical protein JB92DRAFT_3133028 [Gautieria morchelliformis]|nr:hypothetical protein JB92DRAFT_3133028 [Gautieria morchelliformis]
MISKLKLEDRIEFGEVLYYFQVFVTNKTRTVAMVRIYSRPDAFMLEESLAVALYGNEAVAWQANIADTVCEVEITALESITGMGVENEQHAAYDVYILTSIPTLSYKWFLYKIDNIVQTHRALHAAALPEVEGLIKTAKGQGFADGQTLVCADEATCDPPASGHVLRVWWTLERPAHTTSTQRIMCRHMTLDSMSTALWSLGAVFTDTDLEATKGTLHASASRCNANVMHDWEMHTHTYTACTTLRLLLQLIHHLPAHSAPAMLPSFVAVLAHLLALPANFRFALQTPPRTAGMQGVPSSAPPPPPHTPVATASILTGTPDAAPAPASPAFEVPLYKAMAALLNDSIDPALSPELAFFPAPHLIQSDLTPDALKTDLHLTQPSQIELYSSFASGSSQVNHFTEAANSNAATVRDPTLQLNSVLGLASCDQLVAARNACILSLESELKGIKYSYLLLLAKIQEPRFNSPSTKIANCSDEENVMTAQLNRSDYPNVPYWTRSDWDLRANSSVGMPEDDTNANNDSLPCKSMAFITTQDGAPTTNAQAKAIRKTERHVWSELVKTHTDPVSWAKAPISTLDFYRDEMYKHHPDLQLCEGHWKADLLAILDYPSWHRNPKNSSIPLKVKVEQPLTSQPVAPTSTMPSKKQHVFSLHGPHKKKKQNDGEATNLAPGTKSEPSPQPLVTKILGDSTNKRTPIIVDSLGHSEPAKPGSTAPDPAPSTTPPDAGDSLMTDHSIGSPAPPTPGLGDFVVADILVNVQFTVLSPTPEAKLLAAPSVPILEGSISTEEATKLLPAPTAASPNASWRYWQYTILSLCSELRNGASLPITDILPKMVQATSAVAASTGAKSLKRAYFYPEKNKTNSPFNLLAIDYCRTHSKLFKESVQQAYDVLCQDLKIVHMDNYLCNRSSDDVLQHYMELSTYNKLNKLKPQTRIGPAGPITPINHW